MIPILVFTVDTEERVGDPISFEATAPAAAVLLEAWASFYHNDEGFVSISDGREWSGEFVLGGLNNSFDYFIEGLRN